MIKRSISRLAWAILVAIVSVGALIAWGVSQTSTQSGKVRIEIVAVPSDAIVKLNGERVTASTYVTPGNFSVSGYKEGFYEENYRLDIIDNNQKVFVVLNPLSDSAIAWVNDHQSDYSQAQAQIEQQTLSSTTAFVNKYPIIAKLPYENYLYTLSYRVDTSDPTGQSIIITINAPEQYRAMAVAKLAELGSNLYSYNYEYTDFTNVFKEVAQ